MSKEEAADKLPRVPSWMVHSKARDVGCSLITIGWLLLFYRHAPWWTYVISLVLQVLAYSTYWDELPANHGKDNFFMHGFFVALALFPIVIFTGMWLGFTARCIALALAMGIWSLLFGNVDIEESGRGGWAQITLLAMLIPIVSYQL
jgi:hypothetical protein